MENGAFAPLGANAPFYIMFSILISLRCVKVREDVFIWVNGLSSPFAWIYTVFQMSYVIYQNKQVYRFEHNS